MASDLQSVFDLDQVGSDLRVSGRSYLEFLRTPALSAGLYVLPAGATDNQSPHSEDEIYFVVAGRGHVTVGDETRPVAVGSVIRAAPRTLHRFHDIKEDLQLLVVFAPPQGSTAKLD